MKTRLKSNRGVTLLELLITGVIVGIISAMAVPRFQIAFDRLSFRSAHQDITNTLKLARSLAISDKDQYGVHFDRNNFTVTLFRDLVNTGSYDFVSGDSIVRVDTLPESQFGLLSTDCAGDVVLFRPNGSCRYSGGGYILAVGSTSNVVAIQETWILSSTGRVRTESHYY